MASFSSRGPQTVTPQVLKPDIAAPGLNILAAYSKLESITSFGVDHRYSAFNILSGTSMSCPHAAAAAAYVKSFHPDWSPSAVKSALMTTGTSRLTAHFPRFLRSATPIMIREADDELAAGAGQINPTGAVHPGLVYAIKTSSYIRFLCKQGYNATSIGFLVRGKKKYNCAAFKPAQGYDGLNYPTIHVNLGNSQQRFSAAFHRTVTHVGFGKSVYNATVKCPEGVSVEVVPESMVFERAHQRRSFRVVLRGGPVRNGTRVVSGSLVWSDSRHFVRSQILVYRRLYDY